MNDDDFNKIFGGETPNPQNGNMPSYPNNNEIAALKKSNSYLKIWCITLSVVMLIAIVVFSIVSIASSRKNSQIEVASFEDMAQVVASNTRKSVVQVVSSDTLITSSGSGFIVKTDSLGNASYIMTNKHVISNSIKADSSGGFVVTGKVYVTFFDDVQAQATIVDIDSTYDLAVLKVNGLTLGLYSALEFEPDTNLQYGEFVVAIGNALGLGVTVTHGVVSLPSTILIDGNVEVPVIQTDTAINQGNSGGPLINKHSRVIGVVTYKKAQTSSTDVVPEGMGYAIPSGKIKNFINNSTRLSFDL